MISPRIAPTRVAPTRAAATRVASIRIALAGATALALTLTAGAASAQNQTPTNQDRLGAVVGALFGDRLGLSAMDQAWLRGGRPLRDGQTQFTGRVDAGVRAGTVSASAATRLRADYTALVDLENRYAADGISAQERADLNARYTALTQTLESGASGYGDANTVAEGRAAFDARVDAAVSARRITRTEATRLKADYQAVIQIENRYKADGSINATERARSGCPSGCAGPARRRRPGRSDADHRPARPHPSGQSGNQRDGGGALGRCDPCGRRRHPRGAWRSDAAGGRL